MEVAFFKVYENKQGVRILSNIRIKIVDPRKIYFSAQAAF